MKLFLISLLVIAMCGCASFSKESIKVDKEFHKAVLDTAAVRMEYISCDIGLIDGLGLASVASFPIMTAKEARALLANPQISIIMGEMKALAELTLCNGKTCWKAEDYNRCKVLGLGYQAAALSTIDILRLFPQLAPYLAIFAQ